MQWIHQFNGHSNRVQYACMGKLSAHLNTDRDGVDTVGQGRHICQFKSHLQYKMSCSALDIELPNMQMQDSPCKGAVFGPLNKLQWQPSQ